MRNLFKHGINYGAINLALGSFLVGTLLLFSYKITDADSLLTIGLGYTYLAAIINSLMLILLLINTLTHYKDYKENLLTILILLANIPITYWYIELVFSIESFF